MTRIHLHFYYSYAQIKNSALMDQLHQWAEDGLGYLIDLDKHVEFFYSTPHDHKAEEIKSYLFSIEVPDQFNKKTV